MADSSRVQDRGKGACPECGLDYSRNSERDRRAHLVIHDNAVNGPRTTLKDGDYIVTPATRWQLRNLAFRAAQHARREAGYDFVAFDPYERPNAEYELRAIVRVFRRRVVGLLVTRKRWCVSRAVLDSFKQDQFRLWRPTVVEEVGRHQRRTITMIWVLRKHRGSGIVEGMIRALTNELRTSLEKLGHEMPFTASALRLWRRWGLQKIHIS